MIHPTAKSTIVISMRLSKMHRKLPSCSCTCRPPVPCITKSWCDFVPLRDMTALHQICLGKSSASVLLISGNHVLMNLMFRFGRSCDIDFQPSSITYYVEVFMLLIKQIGISKYHVLGHHSGASIAIEMAVSYADQVLSLCISSPALLNSEEQAGFAATELTHYNKPTRDGTHWNKSWDFINSENPWELNELQDLTLDATRAWVGRVQIYTCVFSQPILELLGQVKCPILALSSLRGVLYKFMPKVKELVRTYFIPLLFSFTNNC